MESKRDKLQQLKTDGRNFRFSMKLLRGTTNLYEPVFKDETYRQFFLCFTTNRPTDFWAQLVRERFYQRSNHFLFYIAHRTIAKDQLKMMQNAIAKFLITTPRVISTVEGKKTRKRKIYTLGKYKNPFTHHNSLIYYLLTLRCTT